MTAKSFLFFLTIFLATTNFAFAGRCEQTELSRKYDYLIETTDGEQSQIAEIRLRITGKTVKKQAQVIVIKAEHLFSDAFADCTAARSFITGRNNQTDDVEDNDFGDFIVADFNFDNREDFAVKQDSGGNGGPAYEFYTQNASGKFEKDSFLTDRVGYFPATIDARRKRLVTYVHADVAGYRENVFKYNPASRTWIALKPIYRKAGR